MRFRDRSRAHSKYPETPLPHERRLTQNRLPGAVFRRAGRRKTDDCLPAISAGIIGADPDITL